MNPVLIDPDYNLFDIFEGNMFHCCVRQGLPGCLIVSDSGDIEAAGCGSLYRTQWRHTGLQIIYGFTPLPTIEFYQTVSMYRLPNQ
jgi:hypothetical protein